MQTAEKQLVNTETGGNTLFLVVGALVGVHILIIAGLFAWLCSQTPKQAPRKELSIEERTRIKRRMEKHD